MTLSEKIIASLAEHLENAELNKKGSDQDH